MAAAGARHRGLVPGPRPRGVHVDLLAAGRISDPFVGDEELRVGWVAERDWEYRREFIADEAVAGQERLALVFDGLDTLADVRLNGELLGSADNMFRTWRWDVTDRLRPGPNDLAVTFRSAVRRGAELESVRHLDTVANQLPGAPTCARRRVTSVGIGGPSCRISDSGRAPDWRAGASLAWRTSA